MTDFANTFAAGLRSGGTAYAAWVGMAEPMATEALLREGYDCAILDVQHGLHDVHSVIGSIGAAAIAGKPALVRIGVEEFANASRYLDSGAVGVIAPMVNTLADAKRFANFMKYPPLGERSWGPQRVLGLTGLSPQEYLAKANGQSLAIAMIETREAMAILDDILAVPGIDGVFVGPSDLSIALTGGATVDAFHPEVDTALKHIVARTKAQGKIASAFCMTGARAGQLATWGYQLLSVGTDLGFLRSAGRQELDAAHGIFSGKPETPKSY